MKIKDLIRELKKIEYQQGNVEVNIYKSFDKKTVSFSEVNYDDEEKDCYIGIYN
jgi:hypothetical protein